MAAIPPSSIIIPSSLGASYYIVDPETNVRNPRGVPVSLDDHNFYIDASRLTPKQLIDGKITFFIKGKNPYARGTEQRYIDPKLRTRYEQVREITLTFKDTLQSQSARAQHEWAHCASQSDPTDEIAALLCAKYQKAFDRYVANYPLAQALQKETQSPSIPPAPHSDQSCDSENQAPYDVTFEIQQKGLQADFKENDASLDNNSTQIQAHWHVLTSSSSVFEALFKSGMKESQTSVIKIKNIADSTFAKFIEYFYTKTAEPNSDREAWDLYHLADMYDVEHLKQITAPGCHRHSLEIAAPRFLTQPQELREALQKIQDPTEMVQAYKKAAEKINQYYSMFLEQFLPNT